MRQSLFLLSLMLFAPVAAADTLRAPWDDVRITPGDAPYTCPGMPHFAKTLQVEGYYTDSHYSIIDPAKKAAYEQADAELTHLGQFAGLAADAYLEKGSRAAAQCVYSLLHAAAEADAWAGEMPHGQGVYDQNWLLSGAAIPYLKVRGSGLGTAQQDAAIRKWFAHLALRVRTYFDNGKGNPRSDAYNNHLYWAGLAIAAQAVACNDREAFLWGLATYAQGVKAIQPDGSLPAEMNRAGRALHYQLYALAPLVMLAEFGEANGIDMYAQNDGAIHRLVKFDTAALEDPSILVARTGVQQVISDPVSGQEIGWAVPYVRRFPDPALSAMIAKAPWVRFWQWGGDPPQPVIPAPSASASLTAFEVELRRSYSAAVAAQFPPPSTYANFLGDWCGQGMAEVRASISDSGVTLILKNENGDASAGHVSGAQTIVAPGWQNVTGTLTPNHVQIDWSNGSFWERCNAVHSGPGPFALTGTWYAQGDRSNRCTIRQSSGSVHIACARAGKASGTIDGNAHLNTNWHGRSIAAIVTADGDHIDWDNGTYWTRASVYKSSSK